MELEGTFKKVTDLMDVFQLIHTGRKTGRLVLTGDHGEVVFHVKDGSVVNVEVKTPVLKELSDKLESGEVKIVDMFNTCLHYISMWDSGNFRFEEGSEILEKETGTMDNILGAIMDFTREQDEIDSSVGDIIKKNVRFELSDAPIGDEVVLSKDEWKVLVELVKYGKSTQEVLFSVVPYGRVASAINTLIKSGLVVPVAPEESSAGRAVNVIPVEKLDGLKNMLVDSMGPMGAFLVDDTLADMGLSNGVPESMLDSFINALSDKIPDDCVHEGEKCRDLIRRVARQVIGV